MQSAIGKTVDRVVCTAIDPTKIHHTASDQGGRGRYLTSLVSEDEQCCFFLLHYNYFRLKPSP